MKSLTDVKSGLSVYFLDVTPKIAAQMLKKNIGNRDIRRGMVKRFVREFETGGWLPNGQPIHLTKSGIFGNGQHRLQAIIDANHPLRMLVVEGLSEEALDTLDEGVRKSPADRLKRRGVARYRLVSASLNAIRIATGTRKPVNMADFWSLYKQYKISFDWASRAIPDKHAATWSSIYGALVMAHKKHGTKTAMLMADSLRDIRNRAEDDPVTQFVKTITNIKFEKNDYQTRLFTFQRVLACVAAYVNAETIERVVPSKKAVDFFLPQQDDQRKVQEAA